MNIYEKMSEITSTISKVAKNLEVDTGKGKSYKAVSEADILAAVKPVEKQFGVYSYPYSRKVVDAGQLESETKYGLRRSLYLRVETVYRFVNIEKPEEYIDIVTYGDGVDTQDKAPGKAMTYGDKYALMKAYKIQTGDDPDAFASEDLSALRRDTDIINATELEVLRNLLIQNGLTPESNQHWPNITVKEYVTTLRKLHGDKRNS